ncbi:hypothetical protein GJ496_001921 [Pomphorhynchus laevis]|nr:hypothetical protein GJ496_001921 [Pomphorhynchus laevis]
MPEETTIIRRAVEHGFRTISGGSGDSTASKALAVASFREQRDNEKAELSRLNDRFAAYIQRVKFLESQNKQLQTDMEDLRSQWGLDAERVRREFEPNLQNARDKLDNITSDKAMIEIQAKRADYDAQMYKQLCDDLANWIAADKSKAESLELTLRDNEEEFLILRSQIEDAENDLNKQRANLDRLYEELQRLLRELDEETLQRIQLENEKQTLEEQIPFINALHEQEMSELKMLSSGHHVDPTTFYRAELQRAIKEIRGDFEALSNAQRRELEEYYQVKTEECRRIEEEQQRIQKSSSTTSSESELVQLRNSVGDNRKELAQLQQECSHLTGVLSQLESDLEQCRRINASSLEEREREIFDLRTKLNHLIASYDEILANKTSLEFEIHTYRRLLEGEEAHVNKSSAIGNDLGVGPTMRSSKYEYSTISSSTNGGVSNIAVSPSSSSTTMGLHGSRVGIDVTNADQQQVNNISSITSKIGGANAAVIPTRITQTEMQAKTTYQRNAKGPVSISECSPDGKYITLDNTSKNKDIDLSGWKLYRKVDTSPDINYIFPSGFRLNSSRNVRVWSRGGAASSSSQISHSDIVNNAVESWGVGVNIVTRLFNDQGEEKATHVQRTVYAS